MKHFAFVLIGLASQSTAYPSGAPAGTCLSLLPRHDTDPQSSPSPYRIEVNSRGNEVQVDLVGNEPFRGFLLNARLASDPSRIVPGFFSPNVDPNAQTLDCIGEKNSGLTHTDGKDKSAIRGVWSPPPGFNERVIFTGAVVKSFDHFWSNLRSTEVQVQGTGAALLKAQIPDQVYDNCGSNEGCFGLPANCIPSRTCDIVLGYREERNFGFFFQITTTAGVDKYAAFGVSRDNLMGDDGVVECVDLGGSLDIRESYNVLGRKFNEPRQRLNVQKILQSSTNGVHTCQWRQPYLFKLQGATFDLRDKNYMLLAMGNLASNGNKRRHDRAIASTSAVDFTAVTIQQGDNSRVWVQSHATLMTLAWLFTAPLGMMLARHFKNVWEDKMLCGTKMWFACHRTLMIITVLFSIAAAVIMLYRFGIFTAESGLHPIIGLICVILCIIQPIMAMFRCHPGTKNRPIFNWAHWFVGNAAQIAGVVAIFLAVDLPKAGLQDVEWFIYLIMAFVIYTVVCHLILQIHVFSIDKKVAQTPELQLQTMGSNNNSMNTQIVESKDSPGSEFRRIMLGIYIVGLLFIVGAVITVVWLTGSDVL